MLRPDDRQLFLDAIRPPSGYQFDAAIGTTFTLDLISLMVLPLSLALSDRDNLDEALHDPLILMECLNRYAKRLVIFYQAGYISVPSKAHPLMQYLEEMVIGVKAPRNGVFHPKLWLLRYTQKDAQPIYRLLNLSRNLTGDRSWDLILQLEGHIVDQPQSYTRPLIDFLHAISPGQIQARAQNIIQPFIKELRYINFQAPEGFDQPFTLVPVGIGGYKNNPIEKPFDRMMVISPFLTEYFLKQITSSGTNHVLISQYISLVELPPEILSRFKSIYILDEMAEQEPEDTGTKEDNPSGIENTELSGLHAKLFIWEKDDLAQWLIGSANATDAAFNNNIEFMVHLRGNRSRIGIDVVLGQNADDQSLLSLLKPYNDPEEKPQTNKNQKKAEDLANAVRNWLANIRLKLSVEQSDEQIYSMHMAADKVGFAPKGTYEIICWPVSLSIGQALSLNHSGGNLDCTFHGLGLLSLTTFIAFQVKAKVRNAVQPIQFVLNLPITGLPSGRYEALLSNIIANQSQFLRYLHLLMADEDVPFGVSGWMATTGTFNWSNFSPAMEFQDMPLLEDLARTLSRSPEEKINRINEIVQKLKTTKNWQEVIPPEFDQLWQTILEAREMLR